MCEIERLKKYEFNFKSNEELKKFIETHNYYSCNYDDVVIIANYSTDLSKVYNELCVDIIHLQNAVRYLESWGIKPDNNYIDVINVLTKRQNEFIEHSKLLDKYVEEKQKKCPHVFYENGYDSHYTYYRCNKCGLEEKG